MVQRRGPESGYDHGAKRQYRRDVWAALSRHCAVPRSYAQAFLMPSLEGDEIDVALSKGFREENLHVCDENPAIVATLKRRYPRLNTYGVDVLKALGRCPSLHVANIDLCGTVWTGAMAVREVCKKLSKATGGVFSVTYSRGRDGIVGDDDRRAHLQLVGIAELDYFSVPRLEVSGTYKIAVQPMGWAVFTTGMNPMFQTIRNASKSMGECQRRRAIQTIDWDEVERYFRAMSKLCFERARGIVGERVSRSESRKKNAIGRLTGQESFIGSIE